jgi:putative ABC transport system substrate-binding protein
MRRRESITLFGGAAAWPLAARAQQAGKIHTIGLLSLGSEVVTVIAPFLDTLRELGWIEGKNVTIESCWAENRVERLPELAAELVRRNVDVIVAFGTPPPLAAKRATTTIRSSWPPPATRWAAGSLPVWRGPAATPRA